MRKQVLLLLFIVPIFGFFNTSYADLKTPAKVISVSAEQPEFSIKLPSNRTTGYRWYFRGIAHHQGLIEPVSVKYNAPVSELAGAGGTEVWKFKVLPKAFTVPLRLKLRFVYARAWEKKVAKKDKVIVYTGVQENDQVAKEKTS